MRLFSLGDSLHFELYCRDCAFQTLPQCIASQPPAAQDAPVPLCRRQHRVREQYAMHGESGWVTELQKTGGKWDVLIQTKHQDSFCDGFIATRCVA